MANTLNKLKDAHLEFIITHCTSFEVIEPEVNGILDWLGNTPLHKLIPEEHIQLLLSKQVLGNPIATKLLEQSTKIVQYVLDHPENGTTPLSSLIPDAVVEEIAQYLSRQQKQRQQMLHELLNNSSYVEMMSQTISHAITDYMNNNPLTKNVPGMGGIMKFGKAALERATSTNLDDTLKNYLGKNIKNLTEVSERLANKHLNDQQVYALVKNTWAKVKGKPVSTVREYASKEVVEDSARLSALTWEHLRALKFIQTQLKDGVTEWYANNKDRTLMDMLSDFHIDAETIKTEVQEIFIPIAEMLLEEGYLRNRISALLDLFYNSPQAKAALEK